MNRLFLLIFNGLIIFTGVFLLSACSDTKVPVKKNQFYKVHESYSGRDTTFIEVLNKDTSGLEFLMKTEFSSIKPILKFTNGVHIPDGISYCYYTEDFGVFYSVLSFNRSFTQLHSTNDSTERVINNYVSHILSDNDLIPGPLLIEYFDTAFVPPLVKPK